MSKPPPVKTASQPASGKQLGNLEIPPPLPSFLQCFLKIFTNFLIRKAASCAGESFSSALASEVGSFQKDCNAAVPKVSANMETAGGEVSCPTSQLLPVACHLKEEVMEVILPWTQLFSDANRSDFGGRRSHTGMSCSSSVKLLMQWASWECETEDAFAVCAQ